MIAAGGCTDDTTGSSAASSTTAPTVGPAPDGLTTTAELSPTTAPVEQPAGTGGPATKATPGEPGLPPSPPPSEPVVSNGGPGATGLMADPGCDGARPRTLLSWQPSGANVQLVAVSARPDGLDSGNYTATEELPAGRSSYELRDSQPGGVYYGRVLTRQGSGWAASETAQFEGPTCVPF